MNITAKNKRTFFGARHLLFLGLVFCIHIAAAQQNPALNRSSKEISCEPRTLRQGDVLTIKTNIGYPYIGYRTPTKADGMNLAVLPDDTEKSGLMEGKLFAAQKMIQIPVDAVVNKATRIFSKAGTYTFYVSQNLETDDGTPSYQCKVTFSTK